MATVITFKKSSTQNATPKGDLVLGELVNTTTEDFILRRTMELRRCRGWVKPCLFDS